MRKSGLAFHCHHDVLCEYVYDFDERVRCIKEGKPKEEQPLRLRLFQIIPADLLPGKDSPEYIAHDRARAALDRARAALDRARAAYDKARAAYDKAWAALMRASTAYIRASTAYMKAYKSEIEELHKKLCPNCPWDGETIFS